MNKKTEDEQRIIDYLNRLVSGRFFQISDLDELTPDDLRYDTPIQDIEIRLLEKVLDQFRQQYKSQIFK